MFKNFKHSFFLFSTKMLVRIANREDPDHCTVCLGHFARQLVFEILEHLQYGFSSFRYGFSFFKRNPVLIPVLKLAHYGKILLRLFTKMCFSQHDV